ncbi:MAG: transporter, family, putative rane transport protein [Gammaproteobacteria bacterium]|nr:transporter, family, putative rane transport protein [Gammaproteobacteria bacterium]
MSSEPISSGTPAYRKLAVALLIAGFATFSLLYSVQSLLPVFARSFNVSAGEASLVVSLATGAMALTLLVASVISDRIGRRQMMTASLFAGSLLTLSSAVLPGWHTLLVTRFLTGIALAGIPAVAMAYVAEEVSGNSIGATMGLYIAGSGLGGMAGRLTASVITDLAGWRVALVAVGGSSLIGALVFWRIAPPSRAFVSRRHDWSSFSASMKILRSDAALPWLYSEGFLLMGSFVTVYNYVSFHLLAPPYSLSQSAVGAIFLFYIVGSFSSTGFGYLAGRLGRRRVFWMPVLALLGGVALTAATPLICIILGIGVVTVGYFGAHSVASSWVSRRGGAARAQAAAFYLFFLYVGSSILGSAGGIAWSRAGWPGVALFTGVLVMAALLIALRLIAVKPLPENMV